MLAHDFSPQADAVALKALVELDALKGQAYLVHVHPTAPPSVAFTSLGSDLAYNSAKDFLAALSENAELHLEKVKDALSKRFTNVTFHAVVREGNPVDEIIEAAKELKVDRIVIGTHGRRGVGRMFMGSVAERVVRLSPVSVLVVKANHE